MMHLLKFYGHPNVSIFEVSLRFFLKKICEVYMDVNKIQAMSL